MGGSHNLLAMKIRVGEFCAILPEVGVLWVTENLVDVIDQHISGGRANLIGREVDRGQMNIFFRRTVFQRVILHFAIVVITFPCTIHNGGIHYSISSAFPI